MSYALDAVAEALNAFEEYGVEPQAQAVAILAAAIVLGKEHGSAIRQLGLADATTPLGAIEALAGSVKEVANAISEREEV